MAMKEIIAKAQGMSIKANDQIVKVVLSDNFWLVGNYLHDCTITYASGRQETKLMCMPAKEFGDLYKLYPHMFSGCQDMEKHMTLRFFPEPTDDLAPPKRHR